MRNFCRRNNLRLHFYFSMGFPYQNPRLDLNWSTLCSFEEFNLIKQNHLRIVLVFSRVSKEGSRFWSIETVFLGYFNISSYSTNKSMSNHVNTQLKKSMLSFPYNFMIIHRKAMRIAVSSIVPFIACNLWSSLELTDVKWIKERRRELKGIYYIFLCQH
jgi:hypothetical protein